MRISDWSSDVCSSDLRSRVSVLTRRRVALGTALAVLLGALAWVGYAVWLRPTEFERASSLLPASTLRVTWTDWAGLRDELGSLSTQELIDRDLTTSSLLSSAAEIKQGPGFSPLDAQWELMGQGRDRKSTRLNSSH